MIDYLVSETTHRASLILDAISQPAAPFYESLVSAAIHRVLEPLRADPRIRVAADRYGNLIACYRHPSARFDASLAVAAHMDHPGYHLISAGGRAAYVSIQGGLPRDRRLTGSAIRLFRKDCINRGVIIGLMPDDTSTAVVELETEWNGPVEHVWGVPEVERFRIDGDMIHGAAMDDLAGCAQQLAALEIVCRLDMPVEFTAVFNRAEEIGFVGAVGACELGSIPSRAVVLCMEASKNLEGARPGNGVILRTGDRQSMFDLSVTDLLDKAAEEAVKKLVPHQKRRMDGGTCEATLYMAYGYETGALAVPLVNYHNHGDSAVEAEAIHRNDLAGGVVILVETARLLAENERLPRALFRENIKARFYKTATRFLDAATSW